MYRDTESRSFKWPRRNRPGSRSIRGDRSPGHTQAPCTSSWALPYAHHAGEDGNLFLMLIRVDHEARRLDRKGNFIDHRLIFHRSFKILLLKDSMEQQVVDK